MVIKMKIITNTIHNIIMWYSEKRLEILNNQYNNLSELLNQKKEEIIKLKYIIKYGGVNEEKTNTKNNRKSK